MAKLTDPTARERPVPRQVGGIVQLPVVGPSDFPARGMIALGSSIQSGADEIYRAQKIEETRINTLRAEDAYNRALEKKNDLTLGDEGFTKLRGNDAVSRPLMTEYTRRYDDVESQISGGLSNDDQRTLFKRRFAVSRLQLQEEILRHSAREGDTLAKEVYDGTLATEQKNAVARWDSPHDIASTLVRINAAIETRAERFGWAPEYKKAVAEEEATKVHAAVIGQALAAGRFEYAQAWYEKHRENIDVGTAKQLGRAVEDGTQKQIAANFRNRFISDRDSIKALTSLSQEISTNPKLDLERQNALLGPIASRIDVLEHRAEIKKDQTLRILERNVNALNARTLAGFEPSFDEFAPVLAAAKGTEAEPLVRQSLQLAAATRDFRLSTPQRQEAMLADLEARARRDPASVDHKVLGHLKTIHEAQGRLLRESPVSFAYGQGLADPVRIDFAQLENQGEQLRSRINTARGMTQAYGADLKPLMPAEVDEIKARLAGAKTEDKMQWFGKLRATSGADSTGYSAMMAQLAPDDPALAQAGEFAGKGRTEAARLILDGQTLLHPPKRSDGSPDQGKLWPMPPETDTRKRFQSLEGDAFAGNAKYRNMAFQSTNAIYAKLTEQAGNATGLLDTRLYERAFTLATGGVDTYRGRSVLLPYGMEYGDFRTGLNARIEDISASGRLADGMTAGRLRDVPVDAIGDGRYAFRVGNGYLVDRDGKAIIVNFNLEPSERERSARPVGRGGERAIAPWERPAPPLERPE